MKKDIGITALILTIVFFIINILLAYSLVNSIKYINSDLEILKTNIETINKNIETNSGAIKFIKDNTVTLEDGVVLVDYIEEFENNFYKAIEVYDENVEIYNKQISENREAINNIIDYLNN